MVPYQSNSLATICQRLTSTSIKQLPPIIPYLLHDLVSCRTLLSAPSDGQTTRNGSETAVLIHKYKTQLSTLLQDKSLEGRWSAVALIKGTIEIGGWEVIQGAGGWIRGLLSILGKPDPPATKKLCILALTRTFLLTQNQQSLVRELTTPSLPAFVTSCLNIISSRVTSQEVRKIDVQNPLLDTVLQAIARILPHHPSSLRPFVSQLRSLIGPLLAPTPSYIPLRGSQPVSQSSPTSSSVALAQRLFALLPYCAPKNTSNEEWLQSVRTLLLHIHRTADHVFRVVIEDRMSSAKPMAVSDDPISFEDVIGDEQDDDLGLSDWRGIHAGAERLVGLMQLLQAYIATISPTSLLIPISSIWSVIERILSIVAPSRKDQHDHGLLPRINPEIGRGEREGLWSSLVYLHEAAIETMSLLFLRTGMNSVAFAESAMEHLLSTFNCNQSRVRVTKSICIAISQIVNLFGPSMTKSTVSSMSSLIRVCCQEILPSSDLVKIQPKQDTNGAKKTLSNGISSQNADSYLSPQNTKRLIATSDLCDAALILLQSILIRLPANALSPSLRRQIDSTAIVTRKKDLMFASVLNLPTQSGKGKNICNILPLLARDYPDVLETEAIIHPRMPVLQRRRDDQGRIVLDDDDNEMNQTLPDLKANGPWHEGSSFWQITAEAQLTESSKKEAFTGNDSSDAANETRYGDAIMDSATNMLPMITSTSDSNKRARENEDVVNAVTQGKTGHPSVDDAGLTAPVVKRVRLDDEVLVVPGSPELALRPETTNSEKEAPPISSGNATTVSKKEWTSTSSAHDSHAKDGDDSDSSFEIPPLNIDFTSDEEEDEEDHREGQGGAEAVN